MPFHGDYSTISSPDLSASLIGLLVQHEDKTLLAQPFNTITFIEIED